MTWYQPPLRQHRANVLVHRGAPQYAAMVRRAEAPTADPYDWKWDETGRGIWVSFPWLDGMMRRPGRAQAPETTTATERNAIWRGIEKETV